MLLPLFMLAPGIALNLQTIFPQITIIYKRELYDSYYNENDLMQFVKGFVPKIHSLFVSYVIRYILLPVGKGKRNPT